MNSTNQPTHPSSHPQPVARRHRLRQVALGTAAVAVALTLIAVAAEPAKEPTVAPVPGPTPAPQTEAQPAAVPAATDASAHAERALDHARRIQTEVLAKVQHQAREAVRHAQLSRALASARVRTPADIPVPPEPPEPPEAPEAPEAPVLAGLDNAMSDAFATAFDIASECSTWNGSRPAAALIVGANLEPADLTGLQEDLNVMARILAKAADKAAGAARAPTALGVVIQTPFASRGPQAVYLDGYGALFTLTARYPLVPPPQKPEKKTDEAEPDNSVWENTRAELYGGGSSPRAAVVVAARSRAAGAEYSADRVERLKSALLDAARNAANIRRLRPEETVVVAVQGTSNPAGKRGEARAVSVSTQRLLAADSGSQPSTTLVVQFKKADAEALAKGKLAPDDFARKATAKAY
jgi:hypothetical protein